MSKPNFLIGPTLEFNIDLVRFMVSNATFNNILAISWQSVLLVEETIISRETTDLSQVTDKTLSNNVESSAPHHEWDLNS
jgi:hypothetical protein